MSGSETDESQHELSYYAKDKVKLMKETLKIIKPKKIKAMAPECIKHLGIAEINSMLLEELLGISNKRLTYIFNGEDVDRETSSSDSEEDKIDIISLDDISDDDSLDLTSTRSKQKSCEDSSKKNKSLKRKLEKGNDVNIKKERTKKRTSTVPKQDVINESEKSKLMSVLELLELQARARAIRSQLAIEAENSKSGKSRQESKAVKQEDSDSDAVIINSPSHNEIIITSESERENEDATTVTKTVSSNETKQKDAESDIKQRKEKLLSKLQKIKLIRHKNTATTETSENVRPLLENITNPDTDTPTEQNKTEPTTVVDTCVEKDIDHCDNDEIVINVDEDEIDSMDNVQVRVEKSVKLQKIKLIRDKLATNETKIDDNACSQKLERTEQTKDESCDAKGRMETSSLDLKTGSIKDINCCDNDEIVINLDEDEMESMDNV
ncbi:hypothetical protein PPYR_05151 [Photinus pyralis]|uniref:Uncharacterized protein n=2 Tax=Photinus pyralis TaxID=7054 RepID=A0A5N4B046_PHOPY|nr:uncharacterized protein LOC116164935 [Photinus pyralis]KAB0802965.1 hypothetical protein PPYR_05151 [Photinus pyralis]